MFAVEKRTMLVSWPTPLRRSEQWPQQSLRCRGGTRRAQRPTFVTSEQRVASLSLVGQIWSEWKQFFWVLDGLIALFSYIFSHNWVLDAMSSQGWVLDERFSIMFENVWKILKSFENSRKFSISYVTKWKLLDSLKTFENFWKLLNTFETLWNL